MLLTCLVVALAAYVHQRTSHQLDIPAYRLESITAVVRACFAALRQIRSVRRSLSRHALLTLVRALIVSKVDYCNSVLAGTPGQLQDRLQSVLEVGCRRPFGFLSEAVRTHNQPHCFVNSIG